MKKGKRQIIEKNPFGEDSTANTQQISEGQSSFDSNFISQPISKPTRSHEDPLVGKTVNKYRGQGSSFTYQNEAGNQKQQELSQITSTRTNQSINVIGVSRGKKADIPVSSAAEQQSHVRQQQKVEREPNDQKKTRIQMLKQKYLKKGAETKPVTQTQEVVPKQSIQAKKEQPIGQVIEAKAQNPKQTVTVSNRQQELKQERSQKGERSEIAQNEQKSKLYQESGLSRSKLAYQDTKTKVQPQIKVPVQGKKQERKSRVPPPPPPNYAKTQAPGYPKPQKVEPPQEQNIQVSQPAQLLQPIPEEKQVIIPSKQVKGKKPPPPPPVSKQSPSRPNTVQQILTRKLKKQVVVPEQLQQDMQVEEQVQTKHQQLAATFKPIQMPIDQQYQIKDNELTPKSQEINLPKVSTKAQFNLVEGVKAWCIETDEPFSKVLLPQDRLISILYKKKQVSQIRFLSKNPNYTLIISKIIYEFVLKSKGQLTQGQKSVLNELALEYFYSDLKYLTPSFLILLVKLGKSYLKKYKQFFRNSLEKYCLDLLQYRQYFIDEQLVNFVQFLLEEIQVRQEDYYLLILLKVTENSITKFVNGHISDPKALLLMVLACQYVYKTNKNVLAFYLQITSRLINEISHQTNLLQSILKYFNKFETHQKYYHLQKQLKLKLINLISKTESSPKPKQQQQRNSSQNKGENQGLMSFWNKAVDKLKNATTQLTQKEKSQPEEPEEDIKWDPVTRRYLVNGKAFEDEQDSRKNENASKLPPTPPPPKPTKSIAPPPPPGNKKPRTVTAVNRYA